MTRYTITTKSGNVIDGLTMNGNMYVSQTEITPAMLTANELKTITIIETPDEGAPKQTTITDGICDGILRWPEGWMFNLREPAEQEKRERELQEQVNMLTDCILEMSEIIYGGDA